MRVSRHIDSISQFTGTISAWLILITILICTFEVIARKVFNSPTFWSYDISYMLGGSAGLLGAAYTMKNKRHVRIDFFSSKLSRKWQIISDIVFDIVLFAPLFIIGNIITFTNALNSILSREGIMSGIWQPPIYPLKTVIFISMVLLLMQVIAEFIRNVSELRAINGKAGE